MKIASVISILIAVVCNVYAACPSGWTTTTTSGNNYCQFTFGGTTCYLLCNSPKMCIPTWDCKCNMTGWSCGDPKDNKGCTPSCE